MAFRPHFSHFIAILLLFCFAFYKNKKEKASEKDKKTVMHFA